jgi:hypothetical protein
MGNTPPTTNANSQTVEVTIDDNTPYSSSTGDTHPQDYMQWYQSPVLPSGHHSVTISQMQGLAVDYLVITPAYDTPLNGETLIVDDTYSGIQYLGSGWSSFVSDFSFLENTVNNAAINAQGFQNGTHQTSDIGDSFTFSYTGKLAFINIPSNMYRLGLYRDKHDSIRHPP